jgi:hypothetical protein
MALENNGKKIMGAYIPNPASLVDKNRSNRILPFDISLNWDLINTICNG